MNIVWKVLVRVVAACGLAVAVMPSAAASTATPTSTAPARVSHGGLTPLVNLVAARILLADKVAAAKFGTSTPIEDPKRERQVLDDAAARADAVGIDKLRTVEFFRAQIEQSKVVQRGLYGLWTRHPELAPTRRPDLGKEVRPELDRITAQFIDQLAATGKLRRSTTVCEVSLAAAEVQAIVGYHLDWLHTRALHGATSTVCNRCAEERILAEISTNLQNARGISVCEWFA
ncbi:gamma subclass chorismate mutase AroQ [Amycolatopsis rubida]|uniref:chorismate mutase n=1 Tax=Amycolatopsis rubida TaxID=112413 RepID=A0ABX0BNQ6_9PSEU|nr:MULTISPECIES: gamma subclass chorismate mutase AroQ [Amycolatopsis]MYW90754.1 gamma subclass chorismate mutase AroQ [Amycolatopsis rubida]NEC55737.1 gamma subclass chorismate mutase AroQ [Amycolatopsis rubida]OAP26190.1 Secreted chorismate mutase precursor [Amycolatopsis sp. M39]